MLPKNEATTHTTVMPAAPPFRHILVPLDGAKLAEEAIPTAIALAQRAGAEGKITLLRVKQVEYLLYPPNEFYELPKAVHPEVTAYLEKMQKRIKAQGVQVETVASYGDPATLIVEMVRQRKCDVIVMVTHARKGGSRLLHGSVADRVLQGAEVPVLLLKHGEQPMLSFSPGNHPRLLVPLDGSPLAESVLPLAMALAKQLSASVTVLRSLDLPELTYSEVGRATSGTDAIHAILPAERQDATHYLEKIQQQFRAQGIPTVMVVTEGGAAEDIAQQAKALEDAGNAVMIVMATHGRTGMGRWLYGSVAGALLHLAGSPLLVIRSH